MSALLHSVRGTIARRLLVNYRVDASVAAALLPASFRPKLQNGFAVAGICLLRLEHMRPSWAPAAVGTASENVAHRIAIVREDGSEGVYVPRRDTSSGLNHLMGGRMVAGKYGMAEIEVRDESGEIDLRVSSPEVQVHVIGREAAALPSCSIFGNLAESSDFFRNGAVGYSPSSSGLDAIKLSVENWSVGAFEATTHSSSFFEDEALFPKGSVEYDHTLIMRNVPHRWIYR